MITASVVTYNHHLLDIEPVLRSLFASPVDIVYVIDHSDSMLELKDEMQAYAQEVLLGEPQLQARVQSGFQLLYYPHENNGYGGGHNYAIEMALKAGSEFHLVANPDIWFGPEVLPQLTAYMVQHREVGQMMPRVSFPNGYFQALVKLLPDPCDIFGRFCLPRFLIEKRNTRYELRHSNYQYPINAPYLSGCFMYLRLSAFVEAGKFDERYFMYAEDIDLTRRIHRKYQTLFFPQVTIYHKFNRQSHRSMRLFLIHVTNLIRYFNHYGWWRDKERRAFNRQCLREIEQRNSNLLRKA